MATVPPAVNQMYGGREDVGGLRPRAPLPQDPEEDFGADKKLGRERPLPRLLGNMIALKAGLMGVWLL